MFPTKKVARLGCVRWGWPGFSPYKDARVYGFDFLMRASSDRIYACLAAASAYTPETVCCIWDAARDFYSDSNLEAALRSILASNNFCFLEMRHDLCHSDGNDEEGIREDCPEEGHAAMEILSRILREILRRRFRDPDYAWTLAEGSGWAELTEALKVRLFEDGCEVIQEHVLSLELGI